jgi:hypothetical protein
MNIKTNQTFNLLKEIHLLCWNERDEWFQSEKQDIGIFINDKWRIYESGDIGRLFKITRRLELRFWPTRKQSQPSQGDFFALQREQWRHFGKGTQCSTVLLEMLTELFIRSYFQQNKLLIYFFSFLWHKIMLTFVNTCL